MFKNKFIVSAALIIAATLLILSGCSLQGIIKRGTPNQPAPKGVIGQPNPEEEKNKEENSEAVELGRGATSQNVRPIDESDHLRGNVNAPVKIIVYSDFECPFCARFAETLKEVEKEFGDKVAIAFRHFPLPFHAQAKTAAIAAECAAEQGKFWEMHDKLFADNTGGRLGIEQFKKDAGEIGLDAAKFNGCLDSQKYEAQAENSVTEGKQAGVTGVPTSFVNGEIVVGAYPTDDFTDSQGRQREGLRKIINNYLN